MLTGYRFHFGVGVGWLKEEFELMRQPFNTRGKKTDEMIDILKDLWDDGYAEHHGELYSFGRCGMFPVPKKPIPIWVGGKTPPAIKRAARCDGAMPMNTSVEHAAELLAMTLKDELTETPPEVPANVGATFGMSLRAIV